MKTLSYIGLISIFLVIVSFHKKEESSTHKDYLEIFDSCEFEGKKLYGKIQLVEYPSQADIKVKIVNAFPDLRVRFVENFANECGEWQIVENNADLKVYITENFPDIKIQPVTSFPGLPN